MRFKGKVAIVTGGGSGIGLATCRLLAEEGAIVAVNDLKAEAVDAVVAEIQERGGQAMGLIGDVSDPEFASASVSRVLSAYGAIDVLVNNAGIATIEPAETYSAWRRINAVNLDAPFYWSQAVAREAMLPAKSGAIVNVSSLAGLNAYPGDVGYIASKHGVVGLTKAMAVEWARQGVRVNCLCPGFTETQIIRDMEEIDPNRFASRRDRIPTRRAATPEQQAEVIAFLASSAASNLTGVILNSDGGQLALSSGWGPREEAQ